MTNRTAFVTGASRGIGRACAQALAGAGARVVLAARNRNKLDEAAAEIRSGGYEVFVTTIDLGSAESIKEAFATAARYAQVLTRHGAKPGDRSYCPVSGVVFPVTDASPHREGGGHTVYFCCESCARYFDEHEAQVSAARQLAARP